MTTTNVFSGINDSSRTSSKVLQPPGGGSSNIFGDPIESKPTKTKPYQKTSLFGSEPATSAASTPQSRGNRPTGAAGAPFASDATPSPQQAAPAKQRTPNPLAPQQQEQAQPAKPKQKASNPIFGGSGESESPVNSTRVRQPPGGASSGLW